MKYGCFDSNLAHHLHIMQRRILLFNWINQYLLLTLTINEIYACSDVRTYPNYREAAILNINTTIY